MKGYFIGMDVGGTYARLKICDPSGQILHSSEGKGGTISAMGVKTMEERFRALLLPALKTCGLQPEECLGLYMGASGVDSPSLARQYELILENMGFARTRFQVSNDCEMLLSLFSGPCIALISGTGSIAMGRDSASSPIARCGGWSFLLSDEGSAPSISFAAMRALLKHWDGQTECPGLAELITNSTGYASPEALVSWCHQNLQNKDQLARLAPLVEQAANAGDLCAQELQANAVHELFELVETTFRKLHLPEEKFSLLLWGSVATQNLTIRTGLCRMLRQRFPQAKAYLLQSSALDCALQLAMKQSVYGMLHELT